MRLFMIALIVGLVSAMPRASYAGSDNDVANIVDQHVRGALREGPGGVAVVVRADGRTLFFNYGTADRTRPITSDTLFNLGSVGKVFDTALLALADQQGDLSLDDPVARHVAELQRGADIRRVTLVG